MTLNVSTATETVYAVARLP